MKKRYSTQDGRFVELDDDEFVKYPKNARLTLVKEEKKKITKGEKK